MPAAAMRGTTAIEEMHSMRCIEREIRARDMLLAESGISSCDISDVSAHLGAFAEKPVLQANKSKHEQAR
jgi:hypothetical protein